MSYRTWRAGLERWATAGGHNLALFRSLDSTQRAARRLLESDEPRRAWWVAFEQTAGHGRYERSWVSPPGTGVYATRLAALPGSAASLLSAALGVALCERLAHAGFSPRLKWPNDLLLEGRKLGGLLTHARSSSDTTWVAAGIGVNCLEPATGSLVAVLPDGATCLERHCVGEPPDLVELTSGLLDAVEHCLSGLAAGADPVPAYRRWTAHGPGDSLWVDDGSGRIEGRFVAISDLGHLELETPEGLRRFSSGEVEDRMDDGVAQ